MDVYIGLDVSLASTAICAVSAQGKIVKETTAASEPDVRFHTAILHGNRHNPMPPKGVGFPDPLSGTLNLKTRAALP
jgi:predicted NBD/HSP70 family sugar kinase